MNLEKQSINNKNLMKLEDSLPFLRPTEEEMEHRSIIEKANELMSFGKESEAIKLATFFKQPKNKIFTEKEQEDFFNARAQIVEQLGYIVTINRGKFFSLEKDGYKIQMKHFIIPSGYGYKGGRIGEIEIKKGEISSLWDHRWDNVPKDKGIIKILNELVNVIN